MTETAIPPASLDEVVDSDAPDDDDRRRTRLLILLLVLAAIGSAYGLSSLMVIGAIVVMIVLHELGHFLSARLTGMKATEFYVGFGPKIWSTRRGETEFGAKAIPAGAYVRIIGMHSLEEVEPEDEERTYRQQTFPRRLLVVAGGPLMNLGTAVILLFILFVGFGRVGDDWNVGAVSLGSAAERAGVQVDDRVLSIDGEAGADWDALTASIRERPGETVVLEVERDGQVLDIGVTVGERLSAAGASGLDGLYEGDVILGIDGQTVASYADFASRAQGRVGDEVEVLVQRGSAEGVVPVTVESVATTDATVGFLGVARDAVTERDDPLTASWQSVRATGEISKAFVVGTAQFFTPSRIGSFFGQVADTAGGKDEVVAPELDTGPALVDPNASTDDQNRVVSIIGVVDFGRQISKEGPAAFIAFLASISIMFGVLNLIPLLPFDGGHITVAVYERLRERNGQRYFVDIAKLMPVMYAVIAVFAVLGLAAAYLDVVDGIQV